MGVFVYFIMKKLRFLRVRALVILLINCLAVPISGQAQLLAPKYPDGANFSRRDFTGDTISFDGSEYLNWISFNHSIFGSQPFFRGSQFDGWVDFDSAYFPGFAILDSLHFKEEAYFTGVRVDSNAFLDHSVFSKVAYFNDDSFRNQARFTGDSFYDLTDFSHSRFDGSSYFNPIWAGRQAYFKADTFRKQTTFTYAVFKSWVDFSGAHFKDDGYFDSAYFSQEAYFNGVRFDSICIFSNTRFDNTVSFFKTRFGSIAYFDQIKVGDSTDFLFYSAILPDTLNFTSIPSIKNPIDLTPANFTDSLHYDKVSDNYIRPHRIFFYKTDISKFHLDYIHFRLYFPEMFNGHRFPDDEKESVYTALLNNFKVNGQGVSYQFLDIEYQKFRWKRAGASALIWLPEYWWNFGYDKEYVFIWTILLVLFFTVINFFAVGYLNAKVYPLENVPALPRVKNLFQLGPAKVIWRNMVTRCWYSLAYTSTIFFRLTLEIGKIRFKERGGTCYLLLIYILGLICLAYMANFVLQKT
jgi:uncharacterized protein YjbI with pentapeptide repeats